jgi:transposase-like protein
MKHPVARPATIISRQGWAHSFATEPLDEVFIRIQGVQHYLWRAVGQDGVALDILVQERRDATAAKRFFKQLLKGLQYEPRVIITDKLRSYGVAQPQMLPHVEHRQSRYLNNRAENSPDFGKLRLNLGPCCLKGWNNSLKLLVPMLQDPRNRQCSG